MMFHFSYIKLQLHIAKNQEKISTVMQILSIIVSMITITGIIYYNGFICNDYQKHLIRIIVYFSLWFYVIKYALLLFYSIDKLAYIKNSLFEFFIVIILILHFISISVLPIRIDFLNADKFDKYYLLGIQICFLIIALIEFSKVTFSYKRIYMSPPRLMFFSYLSLICLGTVLLMMPQMTTDGISFTDAVFTATSASCVTGLSSVDVASVFTFKGKIIIMILVQLGGMSILTFAAFFAAFFVRSSDGIRYQHFVKDMLSMNKMSDSFKLLKGIVAMTFFIELLGALLLYIHWHRTIYFESSGAALFCSIFHSISAFNNAGFSLWSNNLMDRIIVYNYFPQLIIMILAFVGGIGFFTLTDIFHPQSIKKRKKFPWRGLLPGTKIILLTTTLLIIIGTALFFIIEYNSSLSTKGSTGEKIFASFFSVIAARTSGFNTINVMHIAPAGMVLFLMLMFIGASPGSTGGGIKNTTFFVIIKSVIATIKGKQRIEFQKKTIPFELVDKSFSIAGMSLMLIFISVFALSLIEKQFSVSNLLFEATSAFTTTGLSTGIVHKFSVAGKVVLIINMYIGRIGTLTMAFALSRRIKENKHQYPDTYFMVG